MLQKIINLIVDKKCLICGLSGEMICEYCDRKIFTNRVQVCFLCNKLAGNGKTCTACKRKSKLSGVTIGYRLDGEIKKLIYQLKYFGRRDIARLLAKKLVEKIDVSSFDLITFVPSDGKRLRQRGYNQAKILARGIAGQTDLPLKETLLRVKHTPQVGAGRAKRLKLVENNFIPCAKVKNLKILIVDDVLTTGATINECAKVLKNEGAKNIWGLVVAKK
ncbi:MAG: ComF family protein [bacterium]|nr:ComF family protein [bacterium]